MYSLLIKNCGQLLTMAGSAPKKGKAMSDLGIVKEAYILCDGPKIVKIGRMKDLKNVKVKKVIDAVGMVVMPGLIDCHTHLVFAGSRAEDFRQKLEGKSYLEILKSGGGILSTVRATRKASKAELLKKTLVHLDEMLRHGITTVEVKSGYGLDLKSEMKILEVMNLASKKSRVKIVKTFLGAHTTPPEYKGRSQEYLEMLMKKILPILRTKVDFVDIFCEKGVFSLGESKKYLECAKKLGFGLKIHAEQLNNLGASKMAAKLGAQSVDHCDYLKPADLSYISKTSTVAVLLPLVPLFLREEKYANGRAMIDMGVAVAVSTDFNPGSAPTKNIYLAMTMACLKMGLRIEEVLTAVTINAATALGLQKEVGSIEAGKRADIVIIKTDNYKNIPYFFGDISIDRVIVGGKI